MGLYLIIRPSLMSHFYPLPLETWLKGVATEITLSKRDTSSRTRHVISMLLWFLFTQMQYGLGWNATLKCAKFSIIMHQSVITMLMVILGNFKRRCANLLAVIHKLVIKTGVILQ